MNERERLEKLNASKLPPDLLRTLSNAELLENAIDTILIKELPPEESEIDYSLENLGDKLEVLEQLQAGKTPPKTGVFYISNM